MPGYYSPCRAPFENVVLQRSASKFAALAFAALAVVFYCRPAAAQPGAFMPTIDGGLNSLRLSIVDGRLVLQGPRFRQPMNSSRTTNDRRERLEVSYQGRQPGLVYEVEKSKLLLFKLEAQPRAAALEKSRRSPARPASAAQDYEISIHREPRAENDLSQVDFKQLPGGDLTLTVGKGEKQRTLSAGNLWELSFLDRSLFSKELVPLLEVLHPSWPLVRLSEEIEVSIVQMGARQDPAMRERWKTLVRDLGSSSYAQRRNADLQLRQGGLIVLGFLGTYDRARLDPEQRFRIDGIMRELSGRGVDDTPQRAAVWLTQEPATWLALLSSENLPHRELAIAKLRERGGSELEFDPSGPAAKRAEQIAALRKKLEPLLRERTYMPVDETATEDPKDD